MRVRQWAWLVLTGTVLGCSSSSTLYVVNQTNRPIAVTVREDDDVFPLWQGTVRPSAAQEMSFGPGGRTSLLFVVDGLSFSYPPLPLPDRIAAPGSGGVTASWLWDGRSPKFELDPVSKLTRHFRRMVLLGGVVLILITFGPWWLIRRHRRRHS